MTVTAVAEPRTHEQARRLVTDVVVVGAGLSGIDVAYRLTERCPELDYLLLEARERIGGTWDLFRYPGIRSDSDIHTLAFPFRPWPGGYSIVGGEAIRDYIVDTARITGIDQRVRLRTRVLAADWDSGSARWTLTCAGPDGELQVECRFVVFAAGYYDAEEPYDPGFPGVEDFGGTLVHPQHWPQDLDVSGRRVAVIGSGATAVSLVPALAERGAHVTMIQRTPSYVLSQPWCDPVGGMLDRLLPRKAAYRITRAKNTALQWALVQACRRRPERMRALLHRGVVAGVGSQQVADEHFVPPYDPWDQRLCIVPDADLLRAVGDGQVEMVTARTAGLVGEGVELEDGRVVPADVVVTATGLRIRIVGDVAIRVDGERVDASTSYTWYGTMLSGVPNAAVVIGYINLSWTVRADLTARLVTRVLRRMVDTGADVVTPVAPAGLEPGRPMMDMAAGYLQRAAHLMPRATSAYPWTVRQDVMSDAWHTNRADLDDGLRWRQAGGGVRARAGRATR